MKTRREIKEAVMRMTASTLRRVAKNTEAHVTDGLSTEEAAMAREEMGELADVLEKIANEEEEQP